MRTNLTGLVWLTVLVVLGCDSRPRAPELRDDPVYQNDREGFRFLAPVGWTQTARAEVPPGKVEKPRLLVQYRHRTSSGGAELEVALADLPASTDLVQHFAGRSFGVERWQPVGKPEMLTIKNVEAVRYTYKGRLGQEEMTKEVVVFRRGERIYSITGLFSPSDKSAREAVRHTVESMIWKT